MEAPGTSLMNLNAVSEHELTQLPRIGADKARRIVGYRAIRKGFRDWADFAGTPGITEADVEAIRTRAWIGPPIEAIQSVTARRRTARGPLPVRRPRRMIS
ncbi:MAG: helix-hairpin-helix domain-containing protein [candidate division NC10 bacterium]|nr:helix-hairpin-helix domain-containing protein [candidate division NC10 bacterium]